MSLTHVQTFRARYYECDEYGRVKLANYLNYMQEAAFEAATAAGYSVARCEEMGRRWLVRETDIEYLYPLCYGDLLQVRTWLVGFRRVRLCRVYELRLVGSGELVARARSDWVFLDSATGLTVSIPTDMMAAFFPGGPPEQTPPRSRFPSAPPRPPGAFSLLRQAEWRDIDLAHHMNNAVYLAYLEDCGVQAAMVHGWSPPRMRAEGFAIMARRHKIEYRQPCVLGDEVELATWLSDVERARAVRHYTITRVSDGALVARAWMLWEAVDVRTELPIPIPTMFLNDIAPNIAAGHCDGYPVSLPRWLPGSSGQDTSGQSGELELSLDTVARRDADR